MKSILFEIVEFARKDRSLYNSRVLSSTFTCFEAEAKTGIAQ